MPWCVHICEIAAGQMPFLKPILSKEMFQFQRCEIVVCLEDIG